MRSILTFLLFIICFPALSCRPAPFDFEKEVAEADVVAIAYVTGIFAAEAEAGLLNDNEENELIEFRISVPVQKSVRLITERSLKGVANKIYQSSASCSFSEGLMERVVLFKKGSNVWVRELDDNVIKAIENLE
ncbi:hypothetical protein [Pseudoalteromonas sp. 2CM32C]|uniref:hypothetical protein n=2 Tax=unclassified Pseudoalteromonas TaxID=194690 RepID=UPI0020BF8ADE|nr:hypothetical protein [Pseudoalteromonas sp. 2CM32C]MCK8120769.1 hypothetical protein [Pseudoalteromonas sp. 2CM32C]